MTIDISLRSLEWIRAGSPHRARLPPVANNDGRAQDILGGHGGVISENLIVQEDDTDVQGGATTEDQKLSASENRVVFRVSQTGREGRGG